MFRVPSDAEAPTFDETFKVGVMTWLTSSAADRQEWTMRRNIAAQLAQTNHTQRIDASLATHHEQYAARRDELKVKAAQIRAEIRAKLDQRRR